MDFFRTSYHEVIGLNIEMNLVYICCLLNMKACGLTFCKLHSYTSPTVATGKAALLISFTSNDFLNTLYLKRSCNVATDKEKSPKWKVVGSKEFCLEGKILPL